MLFSCDCTWREMKIYMKQRLCFEFRNLGAVTAPARARDIHIKRETGIHTNVHVYTLLL